MRCPHCGNENPETHRFCGMCGASLLQGPGAAMAAPGSLISPSAGSASAPRTTAPTASAPHSAAPESAPSAATATIPRPNPPAPTPATPVEATLRPAVPQTELTSPRPPQRVTQEEPVISGPSFLGLNQPASPPPKRGRLSIDPNSAPSSGNLDYLLEDEEPKSGGAWKVILILVALALAVTFGYLRWKNQGLPFLNPAPKPAAQVPANAEPLPSPGANTNASAPTNSVNTPAGSAGPPSSAATAPASNSSSAPTANSPANTTAAQPSANTSTPSAAAATASGAPNAANSVPAAGSSNSAPAVTPSTAAGASASPTPAPTQPAETAPANPAPAAQPSAPTKSGNSFGASAANEAKDTAAPASEVSKPPAAIKRVDTVTEAQKYLYGKGVPQDCDRGLRLLKPAANGGNPKAMIEMGALYSAGLCTPRDLPTSYRWFAMALRKDPDNESVATDLQKLWGEMTQPERQLAIRLSQ
ncbi:MAG TPA: zinc-ribbon domain-containing protein [Verrucomicrobiae bacterium]|nr:zinc-ribbon domain-containing protein [Verrucomicrobiae bacterium]